MLEVIFSKKLKGKALEHERYLVEVLKGISQKFSTAYPTFLFTTGTYSTGGWSKVVSGIGWLPLKGPFLLIRKLPDSLLKKYLCSSRKRLVYNHGRKVFYTLIEDLQGVEFADWKVRYYRTLLILLRKELEWRKIPQI
jgi:hypothetical protein